MEEEKEVYEEGLSKAELGNKLDGMLFQLRFTKKAIEKVKETFRKDPNEVFKGIRKQYMSMLNSIGGK